jgi:hypothetical protein
MTYRTLQSLCCGLNSASQHVSLLIAGGFECDLIGGRRRNFAYRITWQILSREKSLVILIPGP